MRVRIVLACLVVGAVYAQHEPRKCQQGLPMCKFLRCLSTEYEGTATDHVATTLRNISCNGELLLPIVKYEKLWNGWTDNDNRDLFKACGFEAPKNSTECRKTIDTYKCGIVTVAANAGSGRADETYVARLAQWKFLVNDKIKFEPHYCTNNSLEALDAMGAGIIN
ncbi:unnamed protein product, partial [Mesorhabditis spiculigera]